jgi:hypothetical protein
MTGKTETTTTRCRAITKAGKQCTRLPFFGVRYCKAHYVGMQREKALSEVTSLSSRPLIITGLNQVLIFDFEQVNAFGLEMHVYGGPSEGSINLTPMLLRGLAEMASRCADKLEAEHGF